jgi:hypothetical protein
VEIFEYEGIIGSRQLFGARDESGRGFDVVVGVAIYGSESGRHARHVICRGWTVDELGVLSQIDVQSRVLGDSAKNR